MEVSAPLNTTHLRGMRMVELGLYSPRCERLKGLLNKQLILLGLKAFIKEGFLILPTTFLFGLIRLNRVTRIINPLSLD